MGLTTYQKKRDFARTPEPSGKKGSVRGQSRFVIQKHEARRLHYDFRLEMEGVLKSWAVPKGLPYDRGEKRLAVHVEDHPLAYRDFEGIIPEGNYGAGSVMVWDYGSYRAEEKDPVAALKKGKLDFTLSGKKLKGAWTLVRLKRSDLGKDPWLVIKRETDMKPISARRDDASALTGRSMKRIAADKDAVWESKSKKTPKKKVKTSPRRPGARRPISRSA